MRLLGDFPILWLDSPCDQRFYLDLPILGITWIKWINETWEVPWRCCVKTDVFFLPPQDEEIHPEKERKIGFMDLDSSHTLIITRYHRDVRSSTFSPHPRTGQVPNGMATFRLPVSIGKQLWGNFGATYQCGLCKDGGDPSNCPFFP